MRLLRSDLTVALCMTAVRREFVKAQTYEPILCAQVTSLCQPLYAIEERTKTLSVSARYELRKREATCIWREIEGWLQRESVLRAALPDSRFGKSVGYLKNQSTALQKYLPMVVYRPTRSGGIDHSSVGSRSSQFAVPRTLSSHQQLSAIAECRPQYASPPPGHRKRFGRRIQKARGRKPEPSIRSRTWFRVSALNSCLTPGHPSEVDPPRP